MNKLFFKVRAVSSLIAFTGLIAFVVLSVSNASNAMAQDSASYLAASKKFSELVAQSQSKGDMPRAVSLEVARVIAELSDTKGYLDSKAFVHSDLGGLMQICSESNSIVMSYVLFKASDGIDPKTDRELRVQHVIKVMEKNINRFQGELESLQPFLVHCMAAQIPLLTNFVNGLKPEEFTNTRRAGLDKARQGIWQTYSGFLDMATNPQYQDSYRGAVISSLADTADQYASVMAPVNRAGLLKRLSQFGSGDDQVTRAGLQKIKAAFEVKKCVGLCKL